MHAAMEANPAYRALWWRELDAEWKDIIVHNFQLGNLTIEQALDDLARQPYLACYNGMLVTNKMDAVYFERASVYAVGTPLRTLAGLHYCTALEELDARFNRLENLVGLEQARALKALHVNQNRLLTLAGLEGATALQELYAGHNRLTHLSELEQCPELRHLEVDHNDIHDLRALRRCPRLEVLYCTHNRLTSLDGLEHCARLMRLYCDNNPLVNIDVILQLPQLRVLSVRGCNLPVDMLEKCRAAHPQCLIYS